MLLKHILEGWGNWAKLQFGLVEPKLKNLSKKRLLICDTCYIRAGNICSSNRSDIDKITKEKKFGCGCAIPPKTLVPDSKCPLSKW